MLFDLEPSRLLVLVKHYRMHINDGAILDTIREAINPSSAGFRSVLAVMDSKPIGVCVLSSQNWIMAYVRQEWRGQGIGHRLVDAMIQSIGDLQMYVWAVPGEDEKKSVEFWKYHRILIDEDSSIPMSTQQYHDLKTGRVDILHLSRLHRLARRLEADYISREEYANWSR